MMHALSRAAAAAALASSFALSACGVNSAGQETLLGVATPFTGAEVAVAQSDVQAAIAALPSLCQTFAAGTAMTQAELAVLQQAQIKVSPATLSAISKLSANGQVACDGTVAVLADSNGNAATTVSVSAPPAAPATPAASD